MANTELVQFSRQYIVMQRERNIDIHSTSVDQTTSLSSTVLRLKFLRICFTRVNFFPILKTGTYSTPRNCGIHLHFIHAENWTWNSQLCHFKMVLNVLNSQPSSFPLAFVWPLSRHSVRVNVVRFCSKRSLKGSQWFNTSKNHSKFPVIAQARQIWTRKQTILRCMYPKYVREAGSALCVLFEYAAGKQRLYYL